MMSENQQLARLKRVKETISLFLENKGKISDEQLAHLLTIAGVTTSSSSVGRDLTGSIAKDLLDSETYDYILKSRAENQLKGKQKGGQNYALNNTFKKNFIGEFEGSTRNGRRI